jgi:CBS-domain-containing membrane protein
VLRVRDIMTTDVVTLPPDATLEEAEQCFATHHVSGVPVVDGGRAVGVVSRSDLLDPERPRAPGLCVRDVLMPIVFALPRNAPALSAVRLMLAEGIHRVVILSEDGKVEGIVTPIDVLKAVERGEHLGEGPRDLETHADPAVAVDHWMLGEYRFNLNRL